MSSLKEILLSMDQSLKSIAYSLEQIALQNSTDNKSKEKEKGYFDRNNEETIDLDHKEAQLFLRFTDVYVREEIERVNAGKNKKAARRVSVKLGETLVDFFSKELASLNLLEIERSKSGGLIVFKKLGTPFAVLKFLTDLGYSRSERFYEVIQEIQILAEEEFEVEKEDVFFIVSSLHNGIEKTFVEQSIGESLGSVQDFLLNRKQVQKFLSAYINNVPSLEKPRKNIYFLSSELHPNVLANDLLDDHENYYLNMEDVNHYQWLSSINTFLAEIKKIYGSIFK